MKTTILTGKIKMKSIIWLAGLLVTIGVIALGSNAHALTFDLDYTFSGTPPAGSSPWLRAVIEDYTGGTVKLTMSAVGLTGSEYVSEWSFNLDTSLNPANLTFASLGGTAPVASSVTSSFNCCKADGDGWFDFQFNFPTSGDKFGSLENIAYQIGHSSGSIYATNFNFSSLCSTGCGEGSYYSAAHVQSIGQQEESGWIGSQGAKVPEPTTFLLLGSGLLGLGLLGRRIKR